jgi:hypothetical protein
MPRTNYQTQSRKTINQRITQSKKRFKRIVDQLGETNIRFNGKLERPNQFEHSTQITIHKSIENK